MKNSKDFISILNGRVNERMGKDVPRKKIKHALKFIM